MTSRIKRISTVVLAAVCLLALQTAVAQESEALDLPADLYVLTNDGVVQRFGVGAAGVQNISTEGAYVLDMGVDDPRDLLAYRTEEGLYLINLSDLTASPIRIEAETAGVPPFRGRGRTIAFAPSDGVTPGIALAYTTESAVRVYFDGYGGAVPVFQMLTEAGVYTDLSWSPGGRFLAAQTDANIWWIYRRDAAALTLTSVIPSSIGTAWVSDGEIIFAPIEGGLKIMNLNLANQQTDLLPTSFEYRLPMLDADGDLLVFGRALDDADIPAGYGLLLRLVRGAQQLETIGQTPIELTGLRWVPGGTLMIAFQAGVLAVFDPATGSGFPLPIENAVAYDWGSYVPPELRPVFALPDNPPADTTEEAPPILVTPTPQPVGTAVGMTLPAAGFFLARDGFDVTQVWQLPADNTALSVMTYADFDVTDYTTSPDGSSVVYVSDGGLYLQRGESFTPETLIELRSLAPVDASFHPDGTQIAFSDEGAGVSLITLGVENNAGFEVVRILPNVTPAAGSPDPARAYRRPLFSPDGNTLLVDVYVTLRPDDPTSLVNAVGVFDIASGQLFTTSGVAPTDPRPLNTRWLRDGRILTHTDANTSSDANAAIAPGYYIYSYVGEGGEPTLAYALPQNRIVRTDREIAPGVLRSLLAFADDPAAPLEVMEINLTNGAARLVGTTEPIIGSAHFSPDGQLIGGYRLVAGQIESGALVVVDVERGRQTVISAAGGLAAQIANFSFGTSN